MKLKGLHFADVGQIQEAVTGELKKVQKSLSETVRPRKSLCVCVCMPLEIIFLPHFSFISKKISPKTFGPHCVLQSVKRAS